MTSAVPDPYSQPPHSEEPPPDGGPRRRRPRARTLLPLVVAAWALLELWLLLRVGAAAGGLTVFALLVGAFVLGAVVIKRAGRRAWAELTESLRAGEPPRRGRGGGNAMAMLGGLLLMVPGLASDVLGLLCLFPPTAALLRGGATRYLERKGALAPGGLGDAYQQARTMGEQARIHRPDGKVVQGEVVRDEEPPSGQGPSSSA
ncbi:FxsA family membrane protein [Streptomyces sp. NPDC005438]|uniref:FxsA family membrane protein n=1 Tax=Streptomyces sp. NPDC005438 TaxID=3156880 RepID=UPI0033BB3DDA